MRHRPFTGLFIVFLIIHLIFQLPPVTHVSAQSGAGLSGEVSDRFTGEPVPGAWVTLPELGLALTTDEQGRFGWYNLALAKPRVGVTLLVSAAGYGEWVMVNLPLTSGETIYVNPELDGEPTHIDLPPVSAARPVFDPADLEPDSLEPYGLEPYGFQEFSTFAAGLEMPATIRVGMTGAWQCDPAAAYTVVTVDFKDYVKHVLPNEWYRNTYTEAYRAGAVAVKMYAWYWVENGGKWYNPPADVLDSTCDQYYIPGATFGPTDRAVDYTWNWVMLRDGQIFQPFHKETANCDPPNCMKQTESQRLAENGYTWDQILDYFYAGSTLTPVHVPPAGFNLRFWGNGDGDADRVGVRVGMEDGSPGPAVDIGAQDFTLEWWLKAASGDNPADGAACGPGGDWRLGNVLFDRERTSADGGEWGVSLSGGKVVFGLTGIGASGETLSQTICSQAAVTDLAWHHIAVQRRLADGRLWLFVDGALQATSDGPLGDISYPDGEPLTVSTDAFLYIGASRRDGQSGFVSYNGWLDEIRFSNSLRYPASGFVPPIATFEPDTATAALYHLNEGIGQVVGDSALGDAALGDAALGDSALGDAALGGSPGTRYYGGSMNGPEWLSSDLFLTYEHSLFLPLLMQSVP